MTWASTCSPAMPASGSPTPPGRRKVIIEHLRTWNVFSNSSPVEGITRAIRTFSAPDKKISIYVFGDEFTGKSIDEVVNTVDRLNRRDAQGNRRVEDPRRRLPGDVLGARRLQHHRYPLRHPDAPPLPQKRRHLCRPQQALEGQHLSAPGYNQKRRAALRSSLAEKLEGFQISADSDAIGQEVASVDGEDLAGDDSLGGR